MISSRIYTAASHDSLKPLFSRQNFLQLSAFRKMESVSEKRRGGSRRGGPLKSRGRRPPTPCYSPRSSQSASYGSSMYQKDEPSISTSDIKDNGHCHIGGCQHERVVGEESQDSYSSSRPKRSPFAQDSYNSLNSVPYESSMHQKDEPSIATSDIKDNGPSHIGGHQHELMVGEGGGDRHSSSKWRHSPFEQDSPNSRKSNEQMFQDRMLGEGNRDGNLSYKVRHSPSVEDSSNPCESASYEGQNDEPSIATSDANDNGHSHIGGRQHERKVGEGSQDGYSILRPRHTPMQDSHNSRKSVPYKSSMYQKDEPSIATTDMKDNGPSHIGGRQHEQKVGEGSQDRHSILRPRHTPSAQDSHNSHKSHEQMFQDMTLGDGNQDGNLSYKASYEGQKDKPSFATSDVNDNGRSHIGRHKHERKVGEGSQDRYSISRPRHSPSAQDSPNSHKSASYEGQKDKPSISTSDVNDNGHSHIGGCEHERKGGEGSRDRYSIWRPRHSPSAQDSPNSHKSASYEGQKDKPSIATSDVNNNGHSHIGGCEHERKVGEGSQDRYSISRPRHSPSAQDSPNSHKSGMIQDGAANCNLPQQIDSTEKGMETGFDICPKKPTALVKLKPSLLSMNKEKRKEQKQMDKGHQIKQLRSGMILLKNYLGHSEQVKIISECHKLGLGEGGFYQPGYSDGVKLRLQMMCLGKDWDPENKYKDRRSIDDAEPPSIPDGFKKIVKQSIQDSHDFIRQNSEVRSVEDILPNMKPDICIVNFYTDNGKLGMHQDRDESEDSLRKELPVVSFSIGDSAEFLYGDDRFVDKAEKVTLESGDVLIFGGESRHIFHGVSSIFPGTAPDLLVEETNLRRGRLNLTFRQY